MDATDVYAKTPDGQDEVATRARQLPARQRQLLIMVDGKHSVGEMLAHHPAAAEAQANLSALLEAGLIALVPKPAAPAAPPPPPVLRGDIPAIKRFICTTLHDTLGPDADLFTGKVEAAPDLQSVLVQAEKMREVLRGTSGARKADAFWEHLSTMVTNS
jgi:hypothetical protein